jgi:tRNA1Val (adenine37-N6)-methyltransferase
MGRNNYFKFKQFTVIQEFAAMKVGVDSVILGAWADIDEADSILDIGTGTGLLTLMMAQRSDAKITAIEIDDIAYREALYNVESSPWSNKIRVIHSSFQDFAEKCTSEFDHIVSNPPYFENSSQPEDQRRKTHDTMTNFLLPI